MAKNSYSKVMHLCILQKEQLGVKMAVNFDKRTLIKVVDLPSRGVLYGDKLPDGKVKVAALTTAEEKIFAGSGTSPEAKLDQMIDRCVDLGGKLKPSELLLNDRFFCLVQIRCLSYGENYTFHHKCDNCAKQAQYVISLLKDLELKSFTSEVREPFSVTLPVKNVQVDFKLLRSSDEVDITRYANQRSQKFQDAGDPAYSYRLARHIVAVSGRPVENITSTLEFIESLEGPDSLALRNAIEDADCGYDLERTVDCRMCGAANFPVVLPFTAEFFRPRRTRGNV